MQPHAIALGFMGTIAGAIAACGSEVVPSGEGGAGGSGGASVVSVASTGAATATSTSAITTSTSGPAPVSAASSGPGCDHELFASGELNACGNESCCAQMDICGADAAGCNIAGDSIDESLPRGADLYRCMFDAGCFGAAVCESGVVLDGEGQEVLEFAQCLGESCCAAFTACTAGGTDVTGCVSCLDGDGDMERCADANECALENCENGLPDHDVCDSGVVWVDFRQKACLDRLCCDAFEACSDGGEALQPCVDCFEEGGGPLCDEALACATESCSTDICDSGIQVGSTDLARCLTRSCCEPFRSCVGGDPNEETVNACIDCYNEALESGEPGALCDDAFTCATDLCDAPSDV
jgi:hypothetical protein